MRVFQELGERIQREWHAQHYNEKCFSGIVEQALRQSDDWVRQFSVEEYVTWLQTVERLPPQGDFKVGLGHTPLIVFESGRFFLGLYFWHELVTNINSASAYDVYGVLQGTLLEARYAFEPSPVHFNTHLQWGTLSLTDVRHLPAGAVAATDLHAIHSMYSLEGLTVALVASTNAFMRLRPVYAYRLPGVAADAFRDPLAARRLQTLAVLAETDTAQHLRLTLTLVRTADLDTVYRVLEHLARPGRRFAALATQAAELARERFGEVIPAFMQSFESHAREQWVLDERRSTTDPAAKLLWTLVHVRPGRERVLKTVAAHFPDRSPQEVIAGWLDGFSSHPRDELRLDEVSVFLLKRLFEGRAPEEAVRLLAQVYGGQELEEAVPRVLEQCLSLRKHGVFSGLL
ncbi:hypothetical protein [Corallococcus llansteffanensis]|uniref:Uncharacterized protein n=1 Tax=Corallococcus llansteffanensis TaxID=2316731 RepID=A0A3A8PQ97_9BACT|nr:hypothetical protein [Corallococcus llansteffanensis]RKH57270.1 hypothetical protein D7V93_18770 [Corallococcus llansteffanensis]